MAVRQLLTRGLLVGLLAGVVAFGVAEMLGEPQVSRAIAVQTQLYQQEHRAPDPVLVSRDVQSTFGLATGVLAIGLALGGLFALAFAFAHGRIARVRPRVTSVLVATAGFAAVYLVPFLKYPANPPSVGQPSTIGHRSDLYFGLILISVLSTTGAIILARTLTRRFGGWSATLIALAGFLAVVGVVFVLMPGVDEAPFALPATTLWRFRLASLATQFALWATIGLAFGALTERSPANRRQQALDALR
jgi:hypothetical protein